MPGGGQASRGRIAVVNVFDAWLIIVGLAIGAGLAWLVMLDLRRRDDDIAAREARAEAAWIADTLRSREIAADADAVEAVLHLHRAYLAGVPDDGAARPTHPVAETWFELEDEPGPAAVLADDREDVLDRRFAGAAGAAPAVPTAARPPATGAAPTPTATTDGEPEPSGEALEPAWRDEDMAAAHEALDALLHKAPPED